MEDKIKKVDIYNLNIKEEKNNYENLLNDPDVDITDFKFAYVGQQGHAKVTVWYTKVID